MRALPVQGTCGLASTIPSWFTVASRPSAQPLLDALAACTSGSAGSEGAAATVLFGVGMGVGAVVGAPGAGGLAVAMACFSMDCPVSVSKSYMSVHTSSAVIGV